MYTNNYDQSSTGTNLELSAFLDGDLSRIWFEDCMVKVPNDLRPKGYYGDCYFYLRNEDSPPQEISGWFDLSKVSARQLAQHFIVWELGENCGYRELADFFRQYDLSFSRSADSPLSVSDLIFFIDRELQDSELAEFYSELATIKFAYHQSRGYSQGDAVTVFYTEIEDDEEAGVNVPEYIDHIFWDVPAYLRLTINDEEIYLDELLADNYSYSKEDLIREVLDSAPSWATTEVVEFLQANLPNELAYVG